MVQKVEEAASSVFLQGLTLTFPVASLSRWSSAKVKPWSTLIAKSIWSRQWLRSGGVANTAVFILWFDPPEIVHWKLCESNLLKRTDHVQDELISKLSNIPEYVFLNDLRYSSSLTQKETLFCRQLWKGCTWYRNYLDIESWVLRVQGIFVWA